MHARPWFRARRHLALGAALLVGAGCETLTGVNRPDNLRVEVESEEAGEITLVTSDFFVVLSGAAQSTDCQSRIQFITADTQTVALPFRATFPFTAREQYYVQATPTARDRPTTLSMRISIDGRVWYDDSRIVNPPAADSEDEGDSLCFVYQFNELGVG